MKQGDIAYWCWADEWKVHVYSFVVGEYLPIQGFVTCKNTERLFSIKHDYVASTERESVEKLRKYHATRMDMALGYLNSLLR